MPLVSPRPARLSRAQHPRRGPVVALLLAAVVLLLCGGGSATEFEYAGAFESPDPWYTLTLNRVDGQYADASMVVVVLHLHGEPSVDALTEHQELAIKAANASCPDLPSGSTIIPGVNGTAASGCYTLKLDDTWATSSFLIDNAGGNATAAVGANEHLAIYCEHDPAEFGTAPASLFLRSRAGLAVEMEAVLPAAAPSIPAPHAEKPWGEAIGAAFVTVLCTFSGVVLLAPCFVSIGRIKENQDAFHAIISAFAAGALMAAAFMLLLFEATHLIEEDYPGDEVAVAWRWGACVLGGFILSSSLEFFIGAVSSLLMGGSTTSSRGLPRSGEAAVGLELSKMEQQASKEGAAAAADHHQHAGEEERYSGGSALRIVAGVLIGDAVHNFVDGIFIGAAFLECPALGWTILIGSIAHEITQEVADFIVLTNPKQGGLKAVTALGLNFMSGLLAVVGAAVAVGASKQGHYVGPLLAIGGGVYVHIGASECMPTVYRLAKTARMRIACLLAFVLGCVSIGLVLLKHEHCEPAAAPAGGAAAAHSGHAH